MKSVAPRHVGGSSHLKPSGAPAVQGQRILLHLHRPLSGQCVQNTWEEHSQLSREENMGRGLITSSQGWSPTFFPAGESGVPLLLLARGEARLPFTVCWPGVGGAFLCFPAGSFLPCYASPSLLRGFERKQVLLFPVSYLGSRLLLTLSLGYTRWKLTSGNAQLFPSLRPQPGCLFSTFRNLTFVLQIMVRVFSCIFAGRIEKNAPIWKVEVWFVCFYKTPDARAPTLWSHSYDNGCKLEASNLQL